LLRGSGERRFHEETQAEHETGLELLRRDQLADLIEAARIALDPSSIELLATASA